MKTGKDIALIVLSTDSFKDTWLIFFANFTKFWPEFSGNKYLITDSLSFEADGVITLNPNRGEFNGPMDWGGRLISCLSRIPEDDLLLFLEDYILINSINLHEISKTIDFYFNENIDFLSLGTHDCRRNGDFDLKSDFCKVKRFTKYRVTTAPGLWRKSCLKKYIIKGLNPWQFEIIGTWISMFKNDRFFMLNKNKFNLNYEIVPYYIEDGLDSAIVRGKWQKGIIKHVGPEFLELIQRRGFNSITKITRINTVRKVFNRPLFIFKYVASVLFR